MEREDKVREEEECQEEDCEDGKWEELMKEAEKEAKEGRSKRTMRRTWGGD